MANIKTHLNNIKGALYGKDVRGSIHDGIDAINKEVEGTTKRQVDLESTFDELIINAGNSNAEIVDARVKSDGTSYSKLGDRLNEVDSQLEHNEKVLKVFKVNSNETNDEALQRIFNELPNGGIIKFPEGEFVLSPFIIPKGIIIEGQGSNTTFLKLKDNSNNDFITFNDSVSSGLRKLD